MTEAVLESQLQSTQENVRVQLSEVERLVTEGVSADESTGFDLQIVLGEVLNNIVEHAYSERSDGFIQLRLTLLESWIEVETRDHGKPMPDATPPKGELPDVDVEREDLPEGGFGWHLIQQLTENLTYVREDGENILKFTIPRTLMT